MLNKLVSISITVSILWHPCMIILDSLFEDYDKSAQLLDISDNIKHAIRWDALFFIEIIDHGYLYEKNHAFLPGIQVIGNLCKFIAGDHYLIAFLILGKLANLISVMLLYKITLGITKQEHLSFITGIFFIFNPASVFFNSVYTESFFTLLIFCGGWLQFNRYYISSIIMFSLSLFIRSNGIFYIAVTGYPILIKFYNSVLQRQWKLSIKQLIFGLSIAAIFAFCFALNLYYPYYLYCTSYNISQQPSWCYVTIPNIYSYIQEHFWDVGFLSSYKPRKALFIFQGIQGLSVMAYGIYKWMKNQSFIAKNEFTISQMIQQIVLFIISALIAHVNCSSRFFSTSLFFYWSITQMYSDFKYLALFYLIEFNISGMILYTNYLIWA